MSSFLQCPICQEEMSRDTQQKALLCAHVFHDTCVNQWLDQHSNCPQCRMDINDPLFDSMQPLARRPRVDEDEGRIFINLVDGGLEFYNERGYRRIIGGVDILHRVQPVPAPVHVQPVPVPVPPRFIPGVYRQPQVQPAPVQAVNGRVRRPPPPLRMDPGCKKRKIVPDGCIKPLRKPTNKLEAGEICGRKRYHGSPFCGLHA